MVHLASIFEGWDGYQRSLLHAVTPLTIEQLRWRPASEGRSVGELVRHICMGRITWLSRMAAPGIESIDARVPRWIVEDDGTRRVDEESVSCDDLPTLVGWLTLSWQPIHRLLAEWTVEDLFKTYLLDDYIVSRQWTIWRIMSHDIHHGGQMAMSLALQGLHTPELGTQGGHIVVPPQA